MMQKVIAGVAALVLALTGTSCSTTSTAHKQSAYRELPAKISKGQSKQSDVLAVLGEPDQKRLEPEGETWIYGSDQSSAGESVLGSALGTGIGFVPYAGSAYGLLRSVGRGQQASQPMAIVQFSRSGVVRDYTVTLPQ